MKAILVMDMPSSCLECPVGKDMSIPIETCIKCPFGKCVIDEETRTKIQDSMSELNRIFNVEEEQ